MAEDLTLENALGSKVDVTAARFAANRAAMVALLGGKKSITLTKLNSLATAAGCSAVQSFQSVGRTHVPVGTTVTDYNSNTVGVLLNKTMPGATNASFATQQTFATGFLPNSVVASQEVVGPSKVRSRLGLALLAALLAHFQPSPVAVSNFTFYVDINSSATSNCGCARRRCSPPTTA